MHMKPDSRLSESCSTGQATSISNEGQRVIRREGYTPECTSCQCTQPPPATAAIGGGMLISAASEDHLCALLNLLKSLNTSAPDQPVLVWDLSIPAATGGIMLKDLTRVHSNVALRSFDYGKFPAPHIKITNSAGGRLHFKSSHII